jgi:glucose-6-phosphate isomerase
MLFLLTVLYFYLIQDMVVLPYKDSLLLLSRYLQQLVMESLGKEFDLDGNRVKAFYILVNLLYLMF